MPNHSLQHDVFLFFVEVAYQLLCSVFVCKFQTNGSTFIEKYSLLELVEFDEACSDDFGVEIFDDILIFAVVCFSLEKHHVARDGMNEFFSIWLHGEGFIGGAFEGVSDVSHHSVKEDEIEVVFEVSVTETVFLLLALQL